MCLSLLPSQQQIYDFYETLRTDSNESIEQFQSILEVFVADILKYRKEIKRLDDSFKRYVIEMSLTRVQLMDSCPMLVYSQ